MEKESRIIVTGAKGLAGTAMMLELASQGYINAIGVDIEDYDLLYREDVGDMFMDHRPEYVFHLAAKVGGINANNTQSADFIYENLLMQCNVIGLAHEFRVKKLLFCGSACIYPKFAPSPIEEESLLSTYLEETNKAYAIAKISGVIMCEMFRKQYGCDFISVMPTNLYGENDNFNLVNSHVMPALLRKFHEAKINNTPTVEVWGSGKPKREFLYSGDLVKGLIVLMGNYSDPHPINIGTGIDIPIKDLVEIIRDVVGYKGVISWNVSFPDGVHERRLNISKIASLGWSAQMPFREGISKTYKWFVDNYYTARK